MQLSLRQIVVFAFLALAMMTAGNLLAASWQELEKGLSYRTIKVAPSDTTLHLVKIDLKKFRLDWLLAPKGTRQYLTKLLEQGDAVVAINASFFDPQGRAMGLVIKDGKIINPLRKTSWGVFQINQDKPRILHTSDYRPSASTHFALQAGPRLIINGSIPTFKDALPSRRSALCVTPKKEVIIAVTYPGFLSLQELATGLKSFCKDALNLDGGSSTQFYLKTKKLQKDFPGLEPVPNALAVFRR